MMLFVFASYTVFRVAVLTATLIRLLNTIQYKVLLIDGISKLGENFDYKKRCHCPPLYMVGGVYHKTLLNSKLVR